MMTDHYLKLNPKQPISEKIIYLNPKTDKKTKCDQQLEAFSAEVLTGSLDT